MKVYLFLCRDNGHYALSREQAGANLPIKECASGWEAIRAIEIEAGKPFPLAAAPEAVIAELADAGFYVFGSAQGSGTDSA
jgi:hypothetical protein